MPDEEGTQVENGVRVSAAERLIQSRFTGWICVSIIGTWLVVVTAKAFGYAVAVEPGHTELAREAFIVYVMKKILEKKNGTTEVK